MSILGQRTKQVLELDQKTNEHKKDIDTKAQEIWKKLNEEGFGSVHASMQQTDVPTPALLIGMIIEY